MGVPDSGHSRMPIDTRLSRSLTEHKIYITNVDYGWVQIEASLAVIEELFGPVAPLTKAIHTRAVQMAREHELSVYDALIVAAAQDAGCALLFSEDLQHGQKFGTLTVENPFRN